MARVKTWLLVSKIVLKWCKHWGMVNPCVQGIVSLGFVSFQLCSPTAVQKYSLSIGGFVNRYGNLKKYVVNISKNNFWPQLIVREKGINVIIYDEMVCAGYYQGGKVRLCLKQLKIGLKQFCGFSPIYRFF